MRMLSRVEGIPLASLRAAVPSDWVCLRRNACSASTSGWLRIWASWWVTRLYGGCSCTTTRWAARPRLISWPRCGSSCAGVWRRAVSGFRRPRPGRTTIMRVIRYLRATLRRANWSNCAQWCVNTRVPPSSSFLLPRPFGDELFELMAAMSRAAGRPINWNVLCSCTPRIARSSSINWQGATTPRSWVVGSWPLLSPTVNGIGSTSAPGSYSTSCPGGNAHGAPRRGETRRAL
jgi:hypothetical protein